MPQQLFGDVEDERRIVICDMVAGVGTIVRNGKGDVVIVVAEPTGRRVRWTKVAPSWTSGRPVTWIHCMPK